MSDFDDVPGFDEDGEEIKSRTQIKKEMEALQAVGKKLTELKPSQRKEVPMSDELRNAIHLYCNNITQREARRRQMQYIGKLMRSEDIDAIQAVIDRFDTSSQAYAQALHQCEVWREKLMNGGKEAITDFVSKHPDVDIQLLRQLTRNAIKDAQQNKNTGASKKLFQLIKAQQL